MRCNRDRGPKPIDAGFLLNRRRFVVCGACCLGVGLIARPIRSPAAETAGTEQSEAPSPAPHAGQQTTDQPDDSWPRGDMTLGSENALVTIIEYASMTCGHCAQFHLVTLPALKTSYIEPGKVQLVFREFPLDGLALRASMLARCAGRERYFPMINMLFSQLPQWAGAQDPVAALARLAKFAGMSEEDFQACMNNKDLISFILEKKLKAERTHNIDATPSFIIEGQRHVGALSFERLQQLIDPLIAEQEQET